MNRRQLFQKLASNKDADLQISPSALSSFNDTNNDSIIVAIQLIGGNDGLNTFIPLDKYDYLSKHRKNILIEEKKILKINALNGFHPVCTGFHNLYKEGQFGCIQDVGYPNQNRSHFRSMDIWNSASKSDEMISSGWFGRFLDIHHLQYPNNYPNNKYPDPLSISIGNIVADTCQGKFGNYAYALNHLIDLNSLEEHTINTSCSNRNIVEQLRFYNQVISLTNKYTIRINHAKSKGNNLVYYPTENTLAQQLKLVAKLISGGLQTKIYTLTLGGFDTHAYQTTEDTSVGWHATILKELSDAIFSFQNDLNSLKLQDRVLTFTYSEFGRQIKSNASAGTDHGTAGPMFFFGNKFKNRIIGKNPIIHEEVEDQEGVAMQYDFRDVYSSLLVNWLHLSPNNLSEIISKNEIKLINDFI